MTHHILVVDDYTVTQRVLAHILRRAGYTVSTAGNGLMALAVLKETPVDLIVCDLSMPEMDGITLLEQLKKTSSYMNIPVIILTASGQDSDRVAAQAFGISAFLTKPIRSNELVAAAGDVLDTSI